MPDLWPAYFAHDEVDGGPARLGTGPAAAAHQGCCALSRGGTFARNATSPDSTSLENRNGRRPGPDQATAVAAPADLSADAVDDHVRRASHHRSRAVRRHDPADLLAACHLGRAEFLRHVRGVRVELDRPAHPVRL